MTLYILDTDHLSLYGRNHPTIVARLRTAQSQLTTTAITVEEQLRGRLAQVAEAKDGANKKFRQGSVKQESREFYSCEVQLRLP